MWSWIASWNARVEKLKKCSNVMMNRHLKSPRGKNEKMLKCDNEAWKKWKDTQMWWCIAIQNASVEKVKKCSNVIMNRRLTSPRGKNEIMPKCEDESRGHIKWRFIITFEHFFHLGISNGDSSSHLSICSLFPRGHIKWRFIITFLHYFIVSTRAF